MQEPRFVNLKNHVVVVSDPRGCSIDVHPFRMYRSDVPNTVRACVVTGTFYQRYVDFGLLSPFPVEASVVERPGVMAGPVAPPAKSAAASDASEGPVPVASASRVKIQTAPTPEAVAAATRKRLEVFASVLQGKGIEIDAQDAEQIVAYVLAERAGEEAPELPAHVQPFRDALDRVAAGFDPFPKKARKR